MQIVQFPTKPRLVISSGLVYETRTTGKDGVQVVRHDPPVNTYFLDLHDQDGAAAVWDGLSYEAALEAAREWRAEDIELRDQTGETRGHA